MKKVLILLFVSCLLSVSLYGENLKPEEVNAVSLQKVISAKYPAKLEQGELYVTINKAVIRVVSIQKFKLICFSIQFSASEQLSLARMKELANEFNYKKRFIRVGIGPKGNSYCTYYLVYEGGLEDKNLLSSLDWFHVLAKSWCDYVYMNGREE